MRAGRLLCRVLLLQVAQMTALSHADPQATPHSQETRGDGDTSQTDDGNACVVSPNVSDGSAYGLFIFNMYIRGKCQSHSMCPPQQRPSSSSFQEKNGTFKSRPNANRSNASGKSAEEHWRNTKVAKHDYDGKTSHAAKHTDHKKDDIKVIRQSSSNTADVTWTTYIPWQPEDDLRNAESDIMSSLPEALWKFMDAARGAYPPCEAPSNVTFVTALFDLGRSNWPHFRRPFYIYLAYAVHLLSLNVPLVIYTEPKVEPFLRYFRDAKPHLTTLVVSDLTQLSFAKAYGARIADVMQSEPFHRHNDVLDHPEGFSPAYNVLMNAKLSMLKDTAERNDFQTDHFFWIDMGYGHGNKSIYPTSACWSPRTLIENRKYDDVITYIAVNDVTQVESIFQLYKQRIGPGINGGFFGGTRKALGQFYELYHDVLEDFLSRDMVDDDQTMALECYLRQPQLFNMVPGGWYDVFTLFN